MIYGSVCSGIEAATAAWHPLGWRPAWFCEIDAFPSAVLAHHHPEVPNYGDFTSLLDPTHPARHGDIDLLVGGTPCQSFSAAGGRAGLDDPRGRLMLRYLDLVGVLRPRWVVWENVPGVLSSGGGRDFGSLLGGLADLGYGVAYRVLDARFFGVPQRRRRVFVVGHSGGDAERAARVLALGEGVRGHSAARGKARKEAATAVGSGAAVGGERADVWTLEVRGRDGGCNLEYRADGVANALGASNGGRAGMGVGAVAVTPFDTTQIPSAKTPHAVAQTITAFMATMGGNHGSGYSDGTTPGLRGVGSKTPIAVAIDCVGFQSNLRSHGGNAYVNESITLKASGENTAAVAFKASHDWCPDVAGTLGGASQLGGFRTTDLDNSGAFIVTAFDTTQITNKHNRSQPKAGDPCHPLQATAHPPLIVSCLTPWDTQQRRVFDAAGAFPSLDACANATGGHRGPPALLIADQRGRDGNVAAVAVKASGPNRGLAVSSVYSPSLDTNSGNKSVNVQHGTVVRRLTPRECERLMGFPDDHTLIPWKGKSATDGHRYKALGNSFAVPVVRWIGERIQEEDKR